MDNKRPRGVLLASLALIAVIALAAGQAWAQAPGKAVAPPAAPAPLDLTYPKIPPYFCSDQDRAKFVAAIDRAIANAKAQAQAWADYDKALLNLLQEDRNDEAAYRKILPLEVAANANAARAADLVPALEAERAVAAKMQHIDCKKLKKLPLPEAPKGWTGGVGHLSREWLPPPPPFTAPYPHLPDAFCSEADKGKFIKDVIDPKVKFAETQAKNWKAYAGALSDLAASHADDPAAHEDLVRQAADANAVTAKAEAYVTTIKGVLADAQAIKVIDCSAPKQGAFAPPAVPPEIRASYVFKNSSLMFSGYEVSSWTNPPPAAEPVVHQIWSHPVPAYPISFVEIVDDMDLPDCFDTWWDRASRISMLQEDADQVSRAAAALDPKKPADEAQMWDDFWLMMMIQTAIEEADDWIPYCKPFLYWFGPNGGSEDAHSAVIGGELLKLYNLDANGVPIRDNKPRNEDEPISPYLQPSRR